MDIEIKRCPECGGGIKLMANPFYMDRNCVCFARCEKCRKEYDLPNTKLKVLKNLRISKTTLREAAKEWNLLASNDSLYNQGTWTIYIYRRAANGR